MYPLRSPLPTTAAPLRRTAATAFRRAVAVAFSLAGIAGPASAQDVHDRAGPFPLLPGEREIALARSAAPAQVSAEATVWVLRATGFEKEIDGTNGVSCIVSRDHPESLYPICYDREAARTILPTEIFEVQQRIAGVDEDRIAAAVERGLTDGTFAAPGRGALTWMMSPEQVLYAGANGRRVGAWHPHVMIYIPGATAEDLGVSAMGPTGDFQVAFAGTPRAHLIVHTATWADGAPHGR